MPDSFRLRLNAGDVSRQYPDVLVGHAAWLDWPWKLHRIESDEGSVRFELYDLASDPDEAYDVMQEHTSRVASMTAELEAWQRSVIDSLNGRDYR